MKRHQIEKKFHLLTKLGQKAGSYRVFLKDGQLVYVWGNEAFLGDINLKTVKELENKRESDLFGDNSSFNVEEIERKIRDGRVEYLSLNESRILAGGKKELTTERRPIFNQGGEVVGLIGFYQLNPGQNEVGHPFFWEPIPLPTLLFDLKENCVYPNRQFAQTVLPLPQKERGSIFDFIKSHDDVNSNNFPASTLYVQGKELACFSSHHTDYKVASLVDVTEHARTNDELARTNEWLKAWIWELEYHNRKLEIIHQMGCALQLCRSIADAGTVIKKHLSRLFETLGGAMFIPDETKHRLQNLFSYGDNSYLMKNLPAEECVAFRYGRQLLGRENTCYRCLSAPEGRNFSLMCLPMMISGRPEGVVSLRVEEGENKEHIEKGLLIIAIEYISLAFGNLQLQDQLMHQATRDALTNLYNRRYMEESLNREFYRCQRKGLPLSLIIIDIDFFKTINDRYGHDAGDFVLKKFSSYILQSIRKEDIACRYGGEEFVVILPETPLEAAVVRAEQMRKKIMISSLEYRGEIITDITASMGIATWPQHGDDPLACLKAADLALYRAKEEGRNRVVVASTETAEINGKSYLNIPNDPSLVHRH
ncbi:MAG: diguanylate cyclase [Syntrophales bacterium]|nr:diguanylate cyclase [Syntrophales bacterium]